MPPPSSGHVGPLRPDEALRIAYLTYRGKPHVGGQGVYTRHLTKALVDLGHHVEVFGGQPYPVLDERVPLTKLPSLDIFNDHYPGRFPAYWEIKHCAGPASRSPSSRPARSASRSRSASAPGATSKRRARRVRPRPRQPVPRLRHPRHRASSCRPSSRCTTRSPRIAQLEMEHAPNRRKRRSRRPLVLVREDAGPGRPAACRASSSSARTRSRTSTPTWASTLDRMRLVPGRRRPRPVQAAARRRPRARPADHDRVGRRRPEGPRLPARGDGQAAHRARRHADRHRQAQAGRERCDLIERLGLRDVVDVRVRRAPTSASSSCTPRPSWPSCPACTRASACPRSRRWPRAPPRRHRRRRAARGHRRRRRDRAVGARPATPTRWRRRSAAASTIPSCAPASARPAASGCVERWSWRHCAELTVDQYREVLAMPPEHRQAAPATDATG